MENPLGEMSVDSTDTPGSRKSKLLNSAKVVCASAIVAA
jgi:hypothetical protein